MTAGSGPIANDSRPDLWFLHAFGYLGFAVDAPAGPCFGLPEPEGGTSGTLRSVFDFGSFSQDAVSPSEITSNAAVSKRQLRRIFPTPVEFENTSGETNWRPRREPGGAKADSSSLVAAETLVGEYFSAISGSQG